MNYPDTKTIEIEREGGWMTLWFNQPERRNPLTTEAMAELSAVFEILRGDRSVRGVTLRGRGGIFCAGGDLKAFQEKQDTGEEARADVMALSRGIAQFLDSYNSLPQVTVAVVEGAAMAGGLGLVCCSDVVICETSAKFALTETMIGLSPAQIAPFVIQRLGYSTARRLMLTGARFNGTEAQTLGLADFTADSATNEGAGLAEHEAKIRAQVLRCAPGAVADTKALILALPKLSREAAIDLAAENFTQRMMSNEARDGIASFFEKRKPTWTQNNEN